jgi:hypothetical protein
MPRPRTKKPAHLEVTGLAPLPHAIEEWERALIEPVLNETALRAVAQEPDSRHSIRT